MYEYAVNRKKTNETWSVIDKKQIKQKSRITNIKCHQLGCIPLDFDSLNSISLN